jgi:hypothetical protein
VQPVPQEPQGRGRLVLLVLPEVLVRPARRAAGALLAALDWLVRQEHRELSGLRASLEVLGHRVRSVQQDKALSAQRDPEGCRGQQDPQVIQGHPVHRGIPDNK